MCHFSGLLCVHFLPGCDRAEHRRGAGESVVVRVRVGTRGEARHRYAAVSRPGRRDG